MSGITFTIHLDDMQPREAMERLEGGAGDLSDLMNNIGEALVTSTVERFHASTSPDGVPWPKSLRAQLKGGPTLVDTSLLLKGISSRPGRDYVEVGSVEPYAAIHQTGGTIKPKNGGKLSFTLANGSFAQVGEVTIPARPYLGISDEDEITIGELTEAFFNGLLGGDG